MMRCLCLQWPFEVGVRHLIGVCVCEELQGLALGVQLAMHACRTVLTGSLVPTGSMHACRHALTSSPFHSSSMHACRHVLTGNFVSFGPPALFLPAACTPLAYAGLCAQAHHRDGPGDRHEAALLKALAVPVKDGQRLPVRCKWAPLAHKQRVAGGCGCIRWLGLVRKVGPRYTTSGNKSYCTHTHTRTHARSRS